MTVTTLFLVFLFHISSSSPPADGPDWTSRYITEPEPIFLKELSNYTVRVGSDVTFTCQVQNISNYKAAWFHSERGWISSVFLANANTAYNDRISTAFDNRDSWFLIIRDVQETDAGKYTCSMLNAKGASSIYGYLSVVGSCPAFEPFRCPEENRCISIQYLCDGAPDCSDAYDENPRLCTTARRPPVEETSSFLKSLLASHGPNYLEKLFGSKAHNNLHDLGGVDKVAIALSESEPPEDQIDQLQRVISEKEEENKALKDRVKELESAGRRMEEACQCLPKPPNTTGLVPTKVEYRCKEAKGAGFSLQCSDGDPLWGSCHANGWPSCDLANNARGHLPTFKAPLESDFTDSLPLPISSEFASVAPALLVLSSGRTVNLRTPTPDCTPPPPPPLQEHLFEGVSLSLVKKNTLVACGGSKCFSRNLKRDTKWELFANTREPRMGHSAAALRDGTDRVLLLGGRSSPGTAEIVPDGPSIPLQHFVFQSCAIHLVGQLIVTGGGTQFHQYVDRYDLTGRSRDLTGFLGPLPDMLQGRNGHACGSFTDTNGDQALIVTGGVSPDPNNLAYGSPEWESLDPESLSLRCCNSILLDTTEILLPGASAWTPGAPLARPSMGARAASLPLALFVTGGEVDDEPTDQVMRYMPEEQRWELQDWKLPLPSAYHALLPVDIGVLCT